MREVLNLYKPLGFTPLEAVESYRVLRPELAGMPMTYAGRLDPMAEGVLVVLVGEAVKEREEYLSLDKAYEAEVLFGVGTDSGDVLGLPKLNLELKYPPVTSIGQAAIRLTGDLILPVPAYSSVPVNGKPLFEWARQGRLSEIEIPIRKMRVYKSEFMGGREIPSADLLREVQCKVAAVAGDFRQQAILEQWKKIFSDINLNFQTAHIRVHCGSGTYVRSLAEEFGKRLGMSAVLLNLKRARVGEFRVEDSIEIK